MAVNINDTGFNFLPDVPESKSESDSKSEHKKEVKRAPKEDKLLKSVLKTPKKTTTPVVSSEDEKDALDLRMTISRYADSERFGKYLKEMGFKLKTSDLAKMKKADLESLLDRVKHAVGNRSTKSMIDTLILQGFLAGETLAVRMGAKVQGLTSALMMNEQFLDDLETVRLEYLSFGFVDAKTRLALTTLQTGFVLHTQRNALEGPRPVKQPNPHVSHVNPDIHTDEEATEQKTPVKPVKEPVNEPPKRKRGRPKKVRDEPDNVNSKLILEEIEEHITNPTDSNEARERMGLPSL